MNKIDERIAETEAQWHRYRYETIGVRESSKLFCTALKKHAKKRIGGALKTAVLSGKRATFTPTYEEGRENIVLSLTSTPARIREIFPTLQSLMLQTKKPDLIVLWLGMEGAYPREILYRIKAMGISIKARKDLGPNTKYYYAFREYPNDLIITVDDDILYRKDMIKELYETHQKHPDLVIARRVNKMRFDEQKKLVGYTGWIWEYRQGWEPSFDLLATGVGGVLYPPAVTTLSCWENREFLKICPGCDDIWLKFCELKNGVKVAAVQTSAFDKDVINRRSQKSSLSAENVDRGKNDECIRACIEYFGMKEDLCERVLSS